MTQTDITLGDIFYHPLLTCAAATPVAEAARRMVEAQRSSILVEDEGRIVGIWTERDALAVDLSSGESGRSPISLSMSSPVKTISSDTRIGEAASRFRRESVRHFLVLDDSGEPKGIVSLSDVVINQGVEYYISLRDVASVFSRKLLILADTVAAPEAIREMRQGSFDAIVVERAGVGRGILTERDVLRLVGSGRTGGSVGELASFPLIVIPASASLFQARKQFNDHHIRHLGVSDDHGELLGLISFADILANIEAEYIRELEQALKERDEVLALSTRRQRLAAKVFESTNEAIFVTDADQRIESVNPAFTQITGYAAREALGRKPSVLASGRHDGAFYQSMHRALALTGHWQGEIWNRRRDGAIYVEWISINAVKDDAGKITNYVAVFSDITQRKAAEERLSFLAQHDALTGLPNRVLLDDRLLHAISHAQRNGQKLAVVFLDLIDFKKVNDSVGHHVGDQLLQAVARELSACVRAGDTVARLGGDEFVVLLEEIGADDDVPLIAKKILAAVSRPVALEGRQVAVGCSIGISVYPDDGQEADELIRRADAAMYRAKTQGGSAFSFYTAPDRT
ncbi:cyclic di-GMP phosphodiesterase Gmr [mine drainage metagenome]|uniref:Cyclic di-GMP phosphodiesterase Gmr n=1 Tax=mine drainage metagenome TaxID=410659 RepID=A0A1J5QGY6_9ZZZZ